MADAAVPDGVAKSRERVRHVDKFAKRRGELADATLVTLGELGYARTSLREIAQKTEFTHGLLHYYFRDKVELITFGVRRYKEKCVRRYDDAIAPATSPEELAEAFADAMVATLVDEAPMHRLWYDLRTQSMFEEALRDTVIDLDSQLEAMIWRVVLAYSELVGRGPAVSEFGAYSRFDGLFENCLVRYCAGDDAIPEVLRRQARELLAATVGRADED
ncbi:TetR/AcrR family transcriptional regulator [Gordonia westfalica]|uniref:DNA-binding transcriptional regulator, AcrR family n=1 Tax=Gordonia westfalica TaxID=158898 RepID=A0A1H2IZM8_9ACTN|nr:TetR family transcriptional regulator [Gordonia westfalica]SDU49356.1 DNA-binding transcriptional regulator, AcrR family [Gordonia westfalica]